MERAGKVSRTAKVEVCSAQWNIKFGGSLKLVICHPFPSILYVKAAVQDPKLILQTYSTYFFSALSISVLNIKLKGGGSWDPLAAKG